jgi:hypothetical protein
MTREELKAERSWLSKKANRKDRDYLKRLEKFNDDVNDYNRAANEEARKAVKSLKVGDVVSVKKEYNRKGLWRVEKIMVKNLILVSLSEGNRLRCTASLVEKIEGEDESLVNALDLVGLI